MHSSAGRRAGITLKIMAIVDSSMVSGSAAEDFPAEVMLSPI